MPPAEGEGDYDLEMLGRESIGGRHAEKDLPGRPLYGGWDNFSSERTGATVHKRDLFEFVE